MNIEVLERVDRSAPALNGKVALVTGSTSGIGLGVARALARGGRGNRPQRLRPARGHQRGAGADRAGISGQDALSRRRHVEARRNRRPDGEGVRRVRPARHSRQQRRHPARGEDRRVPDREMGRDPRDQSVVGIPHDAARSADHAAKRLRPHHQYRLGAWSRRLAVQVGLCRRQARRRRAHQGDGARDRRGAHHLQRDLPRLRLYAARRSADRGTGEDAQHPARAGHPRRVARPAAEQALRLRRRARRAHACFWRARRRPRSPGSRCRSTAAGPRTETDIES